MSNLPKGWEIKSIKDLKLDISDGNYSSKYPGVLEISCQSDKIQILRVENARRKTNRF